jgi:hypothetical protein
MREPSHEPHEPSSSSRRLRGNWYEVHSQGRIFFERICGRYKIDCYPIPGSVNGERFTAWYVGSTVEHLGCFDTSKQAVRSCATHFRAMKK